MMVHNNLTRGVSHKLSLSDGTYSMDGISAGHGFAMSGFLRAFSRKGGAR